MLKAADRPYIVPDSLAEGLKLVFCGTAPSHTSAEQKAYYAHKGNRFWPTLHEAGITKQRFEAADYPKLLALGIGFTDLCKTYSGNDHQLPTHGFDPESTRSKILRYQPKILAFTSKNTAGIFLGKPPGKIELGEQEETVGKTRLFALSSTSGANGHWNEQRYIWRELAKALHKL